MLGNSRLGRLGLSCVRVALGARAPRGCSHAGLCICWNGSPGRNRDYWKMASSTVEPVELGKITDRPELITLDCFGTLIFPSQSIGRWYREALNERCDTHIRLPRPALFTAAFNKAYKDQCAEHPCFGATSGMSSRDWWYRVVDDTYRSTGELSNAIDASELIELIPGTFDLLFDEVFATKKGWLLKDDALYTLRKLKEWRDMGGGPKLGVISNFDERLTPLLDALGLAEYFDEGMILDSYSTGSEKPAAAMFNLAAQKVGADPSKCYHVGDSVTTDVAGAVGAGWTAMRVNEWFDKDVPDWNAVESEEGALGERQSRLQLMHWGRVDKAVGMQWYELWGLDDILTLFGVPDDDDKSVVATYVSNQRRDY